MTNAVVTWTTEYYGLAVSPMHRSGRPVDDEILAHISPAHSQNINFFGAIVVDIDGELAQPGPIGYRPLRISDALFRSQLCRAERAQGIGPPQAYSPGP